PFLKGERAEPPHSALFWRMGGQEAIRRGDWKLVRYDEAADHTDVRSAQGQKLNLTPTRLYHLGRDPGEKDDLASKEPAIFREMSAAWTAWNATLATPLWGPQQAAGAH